LELWTQLRSVSEILRDVQEALSHGVKILETPPTLPGQVGEARLTGVLEGNV
jgi:hypothetical protein